MIVYCDWCRRSGVGSRFPLFDVRVVLGAADRGRARVCDRCAPHFPLADGSAS